jgi:glycerol-3-phosphate acyltransferase PlsY
VPIVLVVIAAYLVGSIPGAVLVGRSRGHDPTAEGSGNPGASNAYRLMGWRAGALVLAIDAAKGAAAAGGGNAISGRGGLFAAGAAAVVGHCYPVGRWRQGGKGVATAAGMGTVAFPALAAIAAGAWAIVAIVTRKASLASLAAVVAFMTAVIASGQPAGEIAAVTGVAALVVLRHAGNLRRLAAGRERSLH